MSPSKTIIIFRAVGPINNTYLSKELSILDYKVITFPILKVKKIYDAKLQISPNDLVITTSFYGVYYLTKLTTERNFYIYTLGKATKNLAEKMGFKNIIECNGDSVNILEHFVKYNNELYNIVDIVMEGGLMAPQPKTKSER